MNDKPRSVPDWHSYFLRLAAAAAVRSKDPSTQVGCVLVDDQNRVVGTGYNGAPPGVPDQSLDWSRPAKYDHVLHAELNAIVHARRNLSHCTLYVTGHPCLQCTKVIAASGIRRVVYSPMAITMVDREEMTRARRLAELAGVEILQWR